VGNCDEEGRVRCGNAASAAEWDRGAIGPGREAVAGESVENSVFEPKLLVVTVGTTVRWVNGDDVPHTVTSTVAPPLFDSRTLRADGTFSFKFKAAGTYEYFCKVHPDMTRKVVVKQGGSERVRARNGADWGAHHMWDSRLAGFSAPSRARGTSVPGPPGQSHRVLLKNSARLVSLRISAMTSSYLTPA
jgi:plastocyanin